MAGRLWGGQWRDGLTHEETTLETIVVRTAQQIGVCGGPPHAPVMTTMKTIVTITITRQHIHLRVFFCSSRASAIIFVPSFTCSTDVATWGWARFRNRASRQRSGEMTICHARANGALLATQRSLSLRFATKGRGARPAPRACFSMLSRSSPCSSTIVAIWRKISWRPMSCRSRSLTAAWRSEISWTVSMICEYY